MNSKKALEFLTEGVCDCPRCSKYVECMDLDESESVCENAKFIIKKDLNRLEQLEKQLNDGTLSDGYHTFNDLYLQRMYLFATIVNQNKSLAWKSFKHEDGELCFGGDWFIVGIDTPKGSYTYHYENKYWDLFQCQELEVGKKWDGHTSKDVDRLLSLHFNAFDQLEKQVIILIEEKKLYEKQIKNWSEKYETVEKELLKTKKDFKHSQTSSKNCYKMLKEKYTRLERAYKNNEVMTRDLNELINRNLELKDELKRSQETISAWMENHKKLIIDNGKMKKAFKILKEYIMYEELDKILEKHPDLKQVFESVGEE